MAGAAAISAVSAPHISASVRESCVVASSAWRIIGLMAVIPRAWAIEDDMAAIGKLAASVAHYLVQCWRPHQIHLQYRAANGGDDIADNGGVGGEMCRLEVGAGR